MKIKFHWYQKPFQNKAMTWWRSLSTNEQNGFQRKHDGLIIAGSLLRSEIARIFEIENPTEA